MAINAWLARGFDKQSKGTARRMIPNATFVRRVFFYGICIACGFGMHCCARWLNLDEGNQEKLFNGLAYFLGAIQTLTLFSAKKWAELNVGEGIRPHARERIFTEARNRKRKVFLRLITGIGYAALLRTSAAMLIDSQQQLSSLWSSIGFSSVIAGFLCLGISIADFYQLTETTSKLSKLAEDDRRRKKQLEILAGDTQEGSQY